VTDDMPAGLPADTVLRPRYREGQWLRSGDLRDEQGYRLRLSRLHELGQHRWGIAEGLGVADGASGFTVLPGTAVDGYGRTLTVTDPLEVPGSVFDRYGTDQLDAWLFYGREPANPPQRGSWPCGPGQHSRWVEQPRLGYTRAGPLPVNPRQPPGVPQPDLRFPPHRPPPDDPGRQWPVYLGRLRRKPAAGAAAPGYSSDTSTRPYAGLAGTAVSAPSGRASIQVGGERQADTRRFAVSVAAAPATDSATGQAGATVGPASSGPPGGAAVTATDRLVVDAKGHSTLAGAVWVSGAVRVQAPAPDAAQNNAAGHATEAAPRLTFQPSAARAVPAPWTVSHVEPAPPAHSPRQLRVEIGAPGEQGDPSLYRLQIGRRGDAGGFSPCLTVDAGCVVTVHGELVIAGQLIEGPIQADPSDPRFTLRLIGQWAGGLTAAARQVDSLYAAELAVSIQPGQAPRPADTFSYTVIVKNTERAAATGVTVYVAVAIDESVVQQRKVADNIRLDAGLSARYQLTYDVPATTVAGQRLTVSAATIGIGPAGNHLSASGQAAVGIQPPSQPGHSQRSQA
jgi:hypothetical protein